MNFIDLIDEHKVKVSIVQESYNSVFDKENIDQLMTNFTEHEKSVILKSVKLIHNKRLSTREPFCVLAYQLFISTQ